MISEEKQLLSNFGRKLRETGFCSFVDGLRDAYYHPHAAWLPHPLPTHLAQSPVGNVFEVFHQGRLSSRAFRGMFSELYDLLANLEPAIDTSLGGLSWRITAYKNLLALREDPSDFPIESSIYVGEDSLRFADAIGSLEPIETSLDLGSGSGISSVALARVARSTTALDSNGDCCRTTSLTASLNNVSTIDTIHEDLRYFKTSQCFDLIVANPPDVPVPENIRYSVAGGGGHDGSELIRTIIDSAPRWASSDATLLLHFHSIGDDRVPFLRELIRRSAERFNWNAVLSCHSRVPMEVRSAVSARWSSTLNPDISTFELLLRFDSLARELSATHFYGCTLAVRTRGEGVLTEIPAPSEWSMESVCAPRNERLDSGETDCLVLSSYLDSVRQLPDGMHELDLWPYLGKPLLKREMLCSLLAGGASLRAATDEVFSTELAADPVNARCLYVLVTHLADALTRAGVIKHSPRPNPRSVK